MYISKKILVLLLMICSFVFGMVYAANTITLLTETVDEGDIISADYFNNLNGEKTEGGYCKYSGDQLVCIDTDFSDSGTCIDGTTKMSYDIWEDDYYFEDCYYYVCVDTEWVRVYNKFCEDNPGT